MKVLASTFAFSVFRNFSAQICSSKESLLHTAMPFPIRPETDLGRSLCFCLPFLSYGRFLLSHSHGLSFHVLVRCLRDQHPLWNYITTSVAGAFSIGIILPGLRPVTTLCTMFSDTGPGTLRVQVLHHLNLDPATELPIAQVLAQYDAHSMIEALHLQNGDATSWTALSAMLTDTTVHLEACCVYPETFLLFLRTQTWRFALTFTSPGIETIDSSSESSEPCGLPPWVDDELD